MKKKTEIIVPIKKYLLLIFVIGGGTIILILGFLGGIFKLITTTNFNFQQDFFGFLILLPPFIMYSMWLIFGYEKLIIDNQTIELIKTNHILSKKTKINISDIKSIKKAEKLFSSDKWIDIKRQQIREMQKAFPFWISMGQLVIKTNSKEISFFNGLTYHQIPKMKERIENEINKNATQHQ